ncbi:hypothetical protein [Actinophytocola oryzae]|nr:hypothetical protein [Actinophytocola oryzae]
MANVMGACMTVAPAARALTSDGCGPQYLQHRLGHPRETTHATLVD